MKKSLLVITILFSYLSSNTLDIKKLQNEFNINVIEVNAFKKRFNSYLKRNCADNFECVKSNINRLKSWETVQNDKFLKYIINKKLVLTKFDQEYWNQLLIKLDKKSLHFDSTQFVSVIDLESQLYILTIWDNDANEFRYIGKDFISSGNIKREAEVEFGDDHYLKTPSGVFVSQIGWRSDGEYGDDNVTLGYGEKDRFVFYFGKQNTVRYNTFDENKEKIYEPENWKLIRDQLDLAVHSHKSSKPMGEPNSHGCIRMTDELNRFLDNNLVLHKSMFKNNKWLRQYTKEPENPNYHNFAGKYLIIFDNI